ncbi:hypothetical protein PIB30_020872 [Stylosanthes scabra]|uniref:Uncharacterized protein n=1 Tax=Stylosanthes scabra TaxID=79078 RepID=A0ABU6WC98_9FABA|nr:hypothetical protein [Stylosanthes scabra]
MEISNLNADVHLHALKSGLRRGKFQETIAVNNPKTLAEFREKEQGQMETEELRQARNVEKSNNIKVNNKPNRPIPSNNREAKKNAGAYKDQKNADRSKYCTFHKKYGHNTDDCVIANDLLERLAREGHLDLYVSGHISKNDK